MEFVGREDDISKINKVLNLSYKDQSVWFNLEGNSGSGKTHLVKQAFNTRVGLPEGIIIYVDVISDEFEANNFFINLVQQVYLPIKYHFINITTVPEKLSLSDFIKKLSFKSNTSKGIFSFVNAAISSIPVVGSFATLPWEYAMEWIHNKNLAPENLFFEYLGYVVKNHRINILIDNYQFLPVMIRRQFEASMNRFVTGISVISIIRTNIDYTPMENFCDNYKKEYLFLSYVSELECKALLKAQRYDQFEISEDDINRIWVITKGNLKNIELILNEIRLNPGFGIISTQSAIMNLDYIQKNILWIAAMFPAGMRETYVIGAIQDILNEMDYNKIQEKITSLINLGYIYLNSSSNDAIKPTHETVINNVKSTINDYDYSYFRNALVQSLENIIYSNGKSVDYAYLIHCWIGISTLEELRANVNIIEELISIKFKENSYYYINDIVIKIREILIYFNDIILKKIMISFQRISDFHNGLALLNELKINNFAAYKKLKIFYAKFLIQTYNFEDALEVLSEMEITTGVLLCRLNALQHLGMDQKARILIQTELPLCEKTEDYYIILRNSAHYFSYKEALNNLMLVLDYFEDKPFSTFTIATIKNNLGVISIWSKEYSLAKKYLTQAEDLLGYIKSNEIFEPFCNQSICALLTHEYDTALHYADKSLEHCPRSLTLDILMLQINRIVITLCSGMISSEEAISILKKLKNDNPIIEDPWYQFHLHYNYNQLLKLVEISPYDYKYIDEYSDGLTKYYVLKSFIIDEMDVQLCLGLSPNWRY
jgi:hypothetical protein